MSEAGSTGGPTETGEPRPGLLERIARRLLARWRRLKRGWRIFLATGASIGTFFAIVTYPAYKVVSRSPVLCTQCHLMGEAVSRWEHSAHNKITCVDCHESHILGDILRLYYTVIEPKTKVSSHAEVDRARCAGCHMANDPRWPSIANTAGHAVHLADAKLECVRCHSPGVHVFTPPERVCAECHPSVTLHEAGMAQVHCLSCHNFLGPGSELTPRASACLACHGVAGGKASPESAARRPDAPVIATSTDVVHGGVACAECHDPHAKDEAARTRGRDCLRCHKGEIAASHAEGPAGHHDCRACHDPHAPRTEVAASCGACHELPHALGLVSVPGTTGAPAPPRFRFEDLPHGGKCQTCHTPHRWIADEADCAYCHAEVAAGAAVNAPEEHATCTGCHNPHSPAPASSACATCHARESATVLAAPAARLAPEHGRCASCHTPHAESEDPARSCAGCHAAIAAGLTAGPAAHERCASCHTPHAAGKAGAADAACLTCHPGEKSAAARPGTPEVHTRCSSCHAVHPGAGPAAPSAAFAVAIARAPGTGKSLAAVAHDACAGCHAVESAGAGLGIGSHRGDCVTCHTPHGPPSTRSACATCHAEVHLRPPPGKGAGPHGKCQSCHTPHASASAAAAACADCHADKAKVARAWRGDTHSGCPGCHDPHAVKNRDACVSCHAGPGIGVAAGPAGHRDCTKCHTVHAPPPPAGKRSGWWKECRDCHAAETTAVAARGPTHGECSSCHAAHDFPVPACTSCHAAAGRGGLHARAEHAAAPCARCHDAHVGPVDGRAPCLACHVDRTAHEPDAKRCAACHPFMSGAGAAPPRAAVRPKAGP